MFEHIPDLVICDIMMPILDGYGVLHMLQHNKETKDIPFIFLTAKTERSDFRKGMEMDADDYIMKPFSGTELLHAPVSLFYILKGKVRAFKRNDDGKELAIELYNAGDFMGYVPLLEGGLYKETAEAMEESEIAIIPRKDFEELMGSHKEAAAQFIRLLAQNTSNKEQQLLGLAYNSLRKKVAEALLILHQKYSDRNNETFTIDISRDNLATIAGTATESLIRTLSEFREEKLIEIKNGSILILNERKLANMVY